MLRIALRILLSLLLFSQPMRLYASEEQFSSREFQEKLNEMLSRTEKSIKLVREQIMQSQTAPFLPELYFQLAELNTQRANSLYYIQMEKQRIGTAKSGGDKAFSPVVLASQEAVSVYRVILKDFPRFEKRPQVLFKLAVVLKSIDEIPQFIKASSEILSGYPNSEEAVKIRLLLGNHYFDTQKHDAAAELFKPVTAVSLTYERNVARYRLGLINLVKEKYADALARFEEVINDPDLKEQDNPYSISLKTRSAKMDLKREALIDSIRAFTFVFTKDPQPVAYYSKLAPTEVHFQEVIEKLAFRYINLKKYEHAIKLLRTLSERTADPQKVMNIYREVLLMIPVKDRIELPVEEMRFVLEKYNLWRSFYEPKVGALGEAHAFFEKQIRDLGTTSHDLAKGAKDPKLRSHYLKRAQEFYHVYLGFYDRSGNSVRIATNLADVYYARGDFVRSGDYYLRVFSGEFGDASEKKLLIENAILCLQRKQDYGFFENVRVRGLLIKAVASYMQFDPSKRRSVALHFAVLKAEYEQGFFPEVLEKLYGFMRRYPKSSQAVKAGEMILDYFHTRNEFSGLEQWAGRLFSLRLPDPVFNRKISQIGKVARSKVLQEKVKAVSGYDEFAQGKSYLTVALSGEGHIAEEALKHALAKSKAERDIQTFLDAATMMAAKEKNTSKRAGIMKSVAREYIRTTRYYDGLDVFDKLLSGTQYSREEKVRILEECVSTALVLRDWVVIERYVSSPLWPQASAEIKSRVREQLTDLIDSGFVLSSKLLNALASTQMTDETLLVLYKAQFDIDRALRQRVLGEVRARCGRNSRQLVCRYGELGNADARIAAFKKFLASAAPTVKGIESAAQPFMQVSAQLQRLEGSGDPSVETAVSLRSYDAYRSFAEYLNKAALANPELKEVLQQKTQETMGAARVYLDKCKQLGTRFCGLGRAPPLEDLLERENRKLATAPSRELGSDAIEELRRNIFASKNDPGSLLEAARHYYGAGYVHHSAATAAYGISLFKERSSEFKALLGCSVMKLGLIREAEYHLKTAASVEGLKENCLSRLKAGRRN